MPCTVEEMRRVLERFRNVDANLHAQALAQLTEIPAYAALHLILEGLTQASAVLVNNTVLTLLTGFLRSVAPPNAELPLEILSEQFLQKLNRNTSNLAPIQERAEMMAPLCHALRAGIPDSLLKPSELQLLTPAILNSAAAINFLRTDLKDFGSTRQYVQLVTHQVKYLGGSVDLVASNLNLVKVRQLTKVFTNLEALGISNGGGRNLEDWQFVNDLPVEWFNQKKSKLNALRAKLSPKLLTFGGVKHILSNLPLKQLDLHAVAIINQLIEKFIFNPEEEGNWQLLHRCFLSQPNFKKCLERISSVVQVIEAEEVDPKKFSALSNDFLLLDESFFGDPEKLRDLGALLKIHPRFYSPEGLVLYRNLKIAKINFTDSYIAALNQVIAKPQLQYLSILQSLCYMEVASKIDEQTEEASKRVLIQVAYRWFSEEGLKKLSLFSEKFYTAESFRCIAELNPGSLRDVDIQRLNASDLSDLRRIVAMHQKPIRERVKLVERFEKLKQLASSAPKTAKKSEELLKAECPLTFKNIFGVSEDESLIVIASDRKAPLTYEELNAKVCIVLHGEGKNAQEIFCSREFIISNYKGNCKHPFNTNREFKAEDILKLTKENIDLASLNQNLNLGEQSNSVALSTLLDSPFLLEIPDVFFANTEYLGKIDKRYLSNEAMCVYLGRYAKSGITLEDIQRLNAIADELFNKFINHDTISNIISALPDKLFDKNQITPEIFVSIPDQWFRAPFVRYLYNSDLITPQLIREGMTFMKRALENFDHAKSIFEQVSGAPDARDPILTPELMLRLLAHHMANPHFEKLLDLVVPHLNLEILDTQAEIDGKERLFVKIYGYVCAKKETNHPVQINEDVFSFLRDKTKSELLRPYQEANDYLLKELHEKCTAILTKLNTTLESYRSNFKTDSNGKLSTTMFGPKEDKLSAYNALLEAYATENLPFLAVLKAIDSHQKELGQPSSLFGSDDLRTAATVYKQEVRELLSGQMLQLFAICKTSVEALHVCLLDDLFFNLLSLSRNLILELARIQPVAFCQLMTTYRFNELSSLLKPDPDAPPLAPNELNSIYTAYVRGEIVQPASPTPSPAPSAKLPVVTQGGAPLNGSAQPLMNGHTDEEKPQIEPIDARPEALRRAQKGLPTVSVVTTTETSASRPNFSLLLAPTSMPLRENGPLSSSQPQTNGHARPPMASGSRLPQRPNGHLPSFGNGNASQLSEQSYQLTDTDLGVGLAILRREIEPLDAAPPAGPGARKKDIILLNPNRLDQTDIGSGGNGIMHIRDVSQAHRGKICAAIMNLHGVHWVNLFVYTPTDPAKPARVVMLDPYFINEHNSKDLNWKEIKDLLSDHNKGGFPPGTYISRIQPDIIQQLNDRDCGIACLQNLEDLIRKDLFIIENDSIKIDYEKLTLHHKRDKNPAKLLQVRGNWELKLGAENAYEPFYLVRSDHPAPPVPYNFTTNVKLQRLKDKGTQKLSLILSVFISQYQNHIETLFGEAPNVVPTMSGVYADLINDFLKNELCGEFQQLVAEFNDLNRDVLNEIPFTSKTIQERLLQYIQKGYRDLRGNDFNARFVRWLVEKNGQQPLREVPNDLAAKYQEFCAESIADAEWLHFFEKDYKHFDHASRAVKEIVDSNKRGVLGFFGFGSNGVKSTAKMTKVETQVAKPAASITGAATHASKQEKEEANGLPAVPDDSKQVAAQFQALLRTERKPPLQRQFSREVKAAAAPAPVPTRVPSAAIAPMAPVPVAVPQKASAPTTKQPVPLPAVQPPAKPIPRVAPAGLAIPPVDALAQRKPLVTRALALLQSQLRTLCGELQQTRGMLFDNGYKQANSMLELCNQWVDWVAGQTDLGSINLQVYFIAKHLHSILVTYTSWGKYQWDKGLAAAMAVPVAQLLDVSEADIHEYNKPELVEVTCRPINSLDPARPERKPGYTWLNNAMKIKFSELQRRYGAYVPVDLSAQAAPANNNLGK